PDRPRVKVTEKRRVRADGPDHGSGSEARAAQPPVAEPGAGPGPGGAETTTADAAAVEEAQKRAEEYREHLQRLAAEFDNYRKRVLKEQTRTLEMASEPLVRRLLEVLDEFELALMHAEQ